MSSPNGLVACTLAAVLSFAVQAPRPAFAEKQDARRHYDKATAAFGLGKYDEAAREYEAAFERKPDPALLYNAAQAYRLARRTERAVELYRNYLRLYRDAENVEDARAHIAHLAPTPAPAPAPAREASSDSRAVVAQGPQDQDSASGTGRGPDVQAGATTAAPPIPGPPPLPGANFQAAISAGGGRQLDPAGTLTMEMARPAPSSKEARGGGGALAARPIFWVVIGVAIVVLAGGAAWLLSRPGTEDPKATLGTVSGI